MTPAVPVVVPAPDPAAAAAIEDAAVTLDSIQEAIDAEAVTSQERADELLREVRECRSTLSQLSQSITQTENPSIQQILIQLGALQTAVEKIQAHLAATPPAEVINAAVVVPEEAAPPANGNQNGSESSRDRPPESSPSPTPQPPPATKKKRYVKV